MEMQIDDDVETVERDYWRVLRLLRSLPDQCALDLGDLADQVGADKLELIQWVRSDLAFARLIESKVTK